MKSKLHEFLHELGECVWLTIIYLILCVIALPVLVLICKNILLFSLRDYSKTTEPVNEVETVNVEEFKSLEQQIEDINKNIVSIQKEVDNLPK